MKKIDILPVIFFLLFLSITSTKVFSATYDRCDTNNKTQVLTTSGSAVGDGITDDTVALQERLTYCSDNDFTCVIPENVHHLVKGTLFMWGDTCLLGPGKISFDIDSINDTYLFNMGISGKQIDNGGVNQIETVFSGEIRDVIFNITENDISQPNDELGRIIYFWRTNGAVIDNNTFEVGDYRYSAMTSGNHNHWLSGIPNYVRLNIVIKNNVVNASTSDQFGSEGLGVNTFDGVLIQNNKVYGVGDDPIGVHWSKNVTVINNELTSVDGRIYVSNSVNVEIANNSHTRVADSAGVFRTGISLIYTGFERTGSHSDYAPTNYHIHHNNLLYSDGAIDAGAAIYLYGSRDFTVEYNFIQNDSSLLNNAKSIHILPMTFSGAWNDPDNLDIDNTARVHQVSIIGNTSLGNAPLRMAMTGYCADYADPINNLHFVKNAAPEYQIYCGVSKASNHIINPPIN